MDNTSEVLSVSVLGLIGFRVIEGSSGGDIRLYRTIIDLYNPPCNNHITHVGIRDTKMETTIQGFRVSGSGTPQKLTSKPGLRKP